MATGQAEPPEPPGDDAARATDQDRTESQPDRDNSTAGATPSSQESQPADDRSRTEDDRDNSNRGSALDDPDRFREATRETAPGGRGEARDDRFDRSTQFDRNVERAQPTREDERFRDERFRDERFRNEREFRQDEQYRRQDEQYRRQDDQFRRQDDDRRIDREALRDDSNTRFVPDPRPGRMSESQYSSFEVDRVRSADIGLWFDRSTAEGLIISDIGSGAISRLGFREGDRIYSVNGIRVSSEAEFVRLLFDPRWRDERVAVIIYRFGRPWTVYVQPAVLVRKYTTVAYDPLDDWGLILDDRYDDYVVVWRVRPRSPAFYAGLRAGDVIVSWQGRRLSGRDEFVRLAGQERLSDVSLDINRNRQTRRIDLDLSAVQRTSARTALRPDFDAEASGAAAARSPSLPRAEAGVRTESELQGTVRPEIRGTFVPEGRVEVQPEIRVDRPERTLFPNTTPLPEGARVERGGRGLFGGRRP
jgi:hypothetical protein